MPVLLRNGGGGKSMKDATAIPDDVAKGKVFYNNNGRQVGNGQVIKTIIVSPNNAKREWVGPIQNRAHSHMVINGSGGFNLLFTSDLYNLGGGAWSTGNFSINGDIIGFIYQGISYYLSYAGNNGDDKIIVFKQDYYPLLTFVDKRSVNIYIHESITLLYV